MAKRLPHPQDYFSTSGFLFVLLMGCDEAFTIQQAFPPIDASGRPARHCPANRFNRLYCCQYSDEFFPALIVGVVLRSHVPKASVLLPRPTTDCPCSAQPKCRTQSCFGAFNGRFPLCLQEWSVSTVPKPAFFGACPKAEVF